jgi:hypothetical protein
MTGLSCSSLVRLLLLVLLMGAALEIVRQGSSAATAPRIEYRVLELLSLDNMKLEAKLNEYGQAGWDLALIDIGNVTKPQPRLILKRVEPLAQ